MGGYRFSQMFLAATTAMGQIWSNLWLVRAKSPPFVPGEYNVSTFVTLTLTCSKLIRSGFLGLKYVLARSEGTTVWEPAEMAALVTNCYSLMDQ